MSDILNKINYKTTTTTPNYGITNDEYYTDIEDIYKELIYPQESDIYKDHKYKSYKEAGVFKDKRIILPCDWTGNKLLNSPMIHFIKNNNQIITEYIDSDTEDHIKFNIDKDILLDMINKDTGIYNKYGFIEVFLNELDQGNIKSLTISGYDPYHNLELLHLCDTDKEAKDILRELKKTDMESILEIWEPSPGIDKYRVIRAEGYGIDARYIDYNDYDIVITNPPFSLMDDLIKKWLSYDHLDAIFLAPSLNKGTPLLSTPLWLAQNKQFLPYQWGQTKHNSYKKGLYLGFNRRKTLTFYNPIYNISKKISIDWITTFDFIDEDFSKFNHYKSGINYNDYKEHYDYYELLHMIDGTNPIKINNIRAIPDNYYGWFIASVNVLSIISNKEFEWYPTNSTTLLNSDMLENIKPWEEIMGTDILKVKGKNQFSGILARRKSNRIPIEEYQEDFYNWYINNLKEGENNG